MLGRLLESPPRHTFLQPLLRLDSAKLALENNTDMLCLSSVYVVLWHVRGSQQPAVFETSIY